MTFFKFPKLFAIFGASSGVFASPTEVSWHDDSVTLSGGGCTLDIPLPAGYAKPSSSVGLESIPACIDMRDETTLRIGKAGFPVPKSGVELAYDNIESGRPAGGLFPVSRGELPRWKMLKYRDLFGLAVASTLEEGKVQFDCYGNSVEEAELQDPPGMGRWIDGKLQHNVLGPRKEEIKDWVNELPFASYSAPTILANMNPKTYTERASWFGYFQKKTVGLSSIEGDVDLVTGRKFCNVMFYRTLEVYASLFGEQWMHRNNLREFIYSVLYKPARVMWTDEQLAELKAQRLAVIYARCVLRMSVYKLIPTKAQGALAMQAIAANNPSTCL